MSIDDIRTLAALNQTAELQRRIAELDRANRELRNTNASLSAAALEQSGRDQRQIAEWRTARIEAVRERDALAREIEQPKDDAQELVAEHAAARDAAETRVKELETQRVPGHYGPYLPGAGHDQARIAEIQLMHGECDPLQCNWRLLLADVERLCKRATLMDQALTERAEQIDRLRADLERTWRSQNVVIDTIRKLAAMPPEIQRVGLQDLANNLRTYIVTPTPEES